MLNTKAYANYIALHKQKKQLEAELKDTKESIAKVEEALINSLLDNGMEKISLNGHTAYINNTTWAKISDKERAIELLKDEGYGDYIKEGYNSQQISRLLRDFEENEQDIPASFKGIIDPVVKTHLNVVKTN